ncbi:DUF3558 domain-containing protein [Mycolicibacterium sp. P9-22]|nr:DUF3558 domain-containing protein [Mycolicibacterium sp. P9-22]
MMAVLPVLTGCGTEEAERAAPATGQQRAGGGFEGEDCHGITDADIARVAGAAMFTKVLVNDTGCFWQENTVIGTFGAGMGISTWWYRGSDMEVERELEKKAGRTLTEISMDGNKGFKAYDKNACSIYVAKGNDLITWSIQTMNPATLPALCGITDELAKLSQDRVN